MTKRIFLRLSVVGLSAVGMISCAEKSEKSGGKGSVKESTVAKIKVLIIDGQNNHNWMATTPLMKDYLEKSGRFEVEVSTSPRPDADEAAWKAWRPDFAKYDVLLNNFNGEKDLQWPDEVKHSFEKAVEGGVGLVNVHAANNGHKGWGEFEKMTGLLWRSNKEGKRYVLDADGKDEFVPVGEGPSAGHGPQHEFEVVTRDQEHPITKGMPKEWKHALDELYHGQRGPAENMTILASAYSALEQKGTNANEPMLWWIPYGEGRVVTCLLGHVGRDDAEKMLGLKCVGTMNIIERSCEWATTGKVTLPVAEDFPTKEEVRLLD